MIWKNQGWNLTSRVKNRPISFVVLKDKIFNNNTFINNLVEANGNCYEGCASVRQYVNSFYKTMFKAVLISIVLFLKETS